MHSMQQVFLLLMKISLYDFTAVLIWIIFKLVFVADPNNVSWWLIALYLGLTLAASIALYRFVEEPGRRWMQRLRMPASSNQLA
jgi:peptidoglycan/LPS O-acetylase OafA/YrhL